MMYTTSSQNRNAKYFVFQINMTEVCIQVQFHNYNINLANCLHTIVYRKNKRLGCFVYRHAWSGW
jgi:hypothetical protein